MSEPSSAPYTDQRVRLVVLGLLQIALGLFAALGAIVSVLGAFFAADVPGMSPASTMIPGVILYVIVATLMIILGVGSILNRRWARALTLILGWIGLAIGILGLIAVTIRLLARLRRLPPLGQKILHPTVARRPPRSAGSPAGGAGTPLPPPGGSRGKRQRCGSGARAPLPASNGRFLRQLPFGERLGEGLV
jgi:hypothetical protein